MLIGRRRASSRSGIRQAERDDRYRSILGETAVLGRIALVDANGPMAETAWEHDERVRREQAAIAERQQVGGSAA